MTTDMTYATDMAPDAAVFDLDLDGLTVYITDKDGRRDMNAEGEPCETLSDLRALIGEIYAEGGLVVFSSESDAVQQRIDVRDALLAEIDAAEVRYPYAVVWTAFHGGGVVSRHTTEALAERAAARGIADCTCGCKIVVTAEELDRLPIAEEINNPYAAAL